MDELQRGALTGRRRRWRLPVVSEGARRKCPYCAEEIAVEAKKCRHCGEWLENEPSVVEAGAGAVRRTAVAEDDFASYTGPGASKQRTGRVLKKEPWALRPDERIIARSQPYVTRYIAFWVIIAVVSFGLLFFIPLFIWLVFRLKRFEWILTERRLVTVGGWLSRHAHNVSLDKINEVNYGRTLLGRVLWGTGTVSIETAATAGVTRLPWVADDDPFRHAIEAAIEDRRRAPLASAHNLHR